jgi:hypothetical protein
MRSFREAVTIGGFLGINVAVKNNLDAYYVAGTQDPLFTHQRVQAAVIQTHLGSERFISVDCGHDPHTRLHEAARVIIALRDARILNP